MTQSELAEKLGVSPQAVSKWVHGNGSPDTKNMAKIEELLGIPMREWADEDEPESERKVKAGKGKAS